MKTVPFTLLAALTLPVVAQQHQHYRFEEDNLPYLELASPTAIEPADFNNDKLTNLPLTGETFHFFGKDFHLGGIRTMAVQTFGNFRIDDDSSAVIIDGVFSDLDSIDGNTSVSWQIDGPGGHKIVKAQWKQVAVAAGQPGNFVNFQIWLHQESGIIELRYGPRSANNASGYTTTTGPYAGAFYSDDSFSKLYQKTWLFGDPTAVGVDSSMAFSFKRLFGIPEEGTVWRFVPKSFAVSVSGPALPARDIRLFPNPFQSQLHVQGIAVHFVRAFDLTGQLVHEGPVLNGHLDLWELKPGMYFLQLTSDEGIHCFRVFKE